MRQHAPFESIYLDKFEVVEQIKGNTRLYPHTEQLPALSRAINLEFYGALPNRIAHVEARADDYHKGLLNLAAVLYCRFLNEGRADKLRLFPVPTPELVTKIGIVQQVSQPAQRGVLHNFRFFTGKDFVPDVHVSGKRLSFTDHVLQRFTERVPTRIGADLTELLVNFYWDWLIAMTVGKGDAFLFNYNGSLLAFPFEESDDEFVVTTCLTVREINSLELELPPRVFNSHYGPAFTPPVVRNWRPEKMAQALYDSWKHKVPLPMPAPKPKRLATWSQAAGTVKDEAHRMGRVAGCRLQFTDNLPGLAVVYLPPRQAENEESDAGPSLEELTALIAADPKNQQHYLDRANLYKALHDEARAVADMDKAIEVQPAHPQAYNERGWMAYKRGDFAAALRDINESLRLNPSQCYAYDTRAWIEHARGNIPAAEADCRQSLEFAQNEDLKHYTRGLLHYMAKDYARAIAEWSQALAARPSWSEDLTPWLGKAEALGKCRAESDETP